MAEIAVRIVVDRLVALMVQESKLLGGVHREVGSIRDELESIQSFLKDADMKAEKVGSEEGVKTWVKQVREVAYRIEDVVDDYMLGVGQSNRQRGFKKFLHKVGHLIKTLKPRHQIASEIKELKVTLHEIKERSKRYSFNRSSLESPSHEGEDAILTERRVAALYTDKAQLVGIDAPRNELVKLLLEGESKRTVIALVGMGGLGKTTLVKKAYDDKVVTGHFDCCAWINVSQTYQIEELLRTAIQEFCQARKESVTEGINTMDMTQLIEVLKAYLREKRYVIVFDDVWGTEFWNIMCHVLPDNNTYSRILITTRNNNVAVSCKRSSLAHIYPLQPLTEEESWRLFCKKTFQFDFEGRCPNELEKLSREILKRCEGLPLAIVAIGGLLSSKEKNVSQWIKFRDSLGAELEYNPDLAKITKILSLSYYDLPYYLKPCILYLGIFPEDYIIGSSRLIRLWIAEGFVKRMEGKTLEEVAEDHLNELICRSLVQVSHVDDVGRFRKCRVHDMIREMILLKSQEMSFAQVFTEEKSRIDEKIRRLSLHNGEQKLLESGSSSYIRSFLVFDTSKLSNSFVNNIVSNFMLLKVLDLEVASVDYLPEEIGNLLQLRYSSVRNTKVRSLPKSMGNLQKLETLDLKHSLVRELPFEIDKLKSLRHLLAYSMGNLKKLETLDLKPSLVNELHFEIHKLKSVRHLLAYSMDQNRAVDFYGRPGVKINGRIGGLVNMQKLYDVEASSGNGLIQELGKLTQLRRLGLRKLKRVDSPNLCTALEKMKQLRSVEFKTVNEDEFIDLESMSSPPMLLQRISLLGRLEKLPTWISKLQNLKLITIFRSMLMEDDPLKTLRDLPNLVRVYLWEAYDGEQLYFKVGCFPKLKKLILQNLNRLNLVEIEEGALPELQVLEIGNCKEVMEVPSGIQHLTNLRSLYFMNMSNEFARRLLPNGGNDYWKVHHISNILFDYHSEGSRALDRYNLRTNKFAKMVRSA